MRLTTWSRRDFLARSALTGFALSRAQTQARAGATILAPAATGPYIDVHTHVGRTWNPDAPLSADALVKWMDEHRVAKAVVLPLVSPESSSYLNLTEQALEAARRFPDRLVPFCCIDPRTSYTGGRAGLRAMLKEYVDQGARGFGEHKVGLPIDHPKMRAVYEVCDDLRLPVLFHMDDQRGTDVPGLPGLERVLKAFPAVQFIGHGPGFWASISGELTARELGGYPAGPVKPGGAIDRLLDAYPNLWCDISAGSGAGALARDPAFGQRFLIRRADRILFGTDYLRQGQKVPQFEVIAGFDLPPEVRAKIERGNAAKLLGLTL
jgi:uncharacterized protein